MTALPLAQRAAARRAFVSIPDLYQSEGDKRAIVDQLGDNGRTAFWLFCETWNDLRSAPYTFPRNADEAWHLVRPIVWGFSLGGDTIGAAETLYPYALQWNEDRDKARDATYILIQTIAIFIERLAELKPWEDHERA